MDHDDHVRLIREGVEGAGPVWADLGSGTGAFTLALADLLGPTGVIHTVDRDAGAIRKQVEAVHGGFPSTTLYPRVADFTEPLGLPALDGMVMANSLHFVDQKAPVLELMRSALRPGGHLVLVEYDADRGNAWVPYPLSFRTWQGMAGSAGFERTRELVRVPSRFLDAIYSALSYRPAGDR
ncbi:MAG: methyltransferase [Candidatus Limnocylindrales bacterium]